MSKSTILGIAETSRAVTSIEHPLKKRDVEAELTSYCLFVELFATLLLYYVAEYLDFVSKLIIICSNNFLSDVAQDPVVGKYTNYPWLSQKVVSQGSGRSHQGVSQGSPGSQPGVMPGDQPGVMPGDQPRGQPGVNQASLVYFHTTHDPHKIY